MDISLNLNISVEGVDSLGKSTPLINGLKELEKSFWKVDKKLPRKKGKSVYLHKWDDNYDNLITPIHTAYSITLNMSDKHDYFPDKEHEKKFFHMLLLRTLQKGPPLKKAVFVREYSPHSDKLHFHGIVWLYNTKNKGQQMLQYREECWKDWTTKRNLACYAINYKKIKDAKHIKDYINYIRKDKQNKDFIYYMY